jgi:hypothetical protein
MPSRRRMSWIGQSTCDVGSRGEAFISRVGTAREILRAEMVDFACRIDDDLDDEQLAPAVPPESVKAINKMIGHGRQALI